MQRNFGPPCIYYPCVCFDKLLEVDFDTNFGQKLFMFDLLKEIELANHNKAIQTIFKSKIASNGLIENIIPWTQFKKPEVICRTSRSTGWHKKNRLFEIF